jgi:hypothetical protein
MKIKITLIYLIFSIYWITTIFFTFPENYLQIKALRYEKVFSIFLYQRWSFFAPPPQTNDRLYFEYITTKKDTVLLEVLKPLAEKRKKEFLFNSDRSVIDYVLANNIYTLSDYLRENYNAYKFENCSPEIKDEDCNVRFLKYYYPQFHNFSELKSLINYGVLIKSESKTKSEIEKLKIIATTVEIPKFNERFNKTHNNYKENMVFETKYYNLKYSKWEE